MLKNRRENSGITLIALIVTIIVLLILAAVSIHLVFGDNGILGNAKTSANDYSLTSAKEKIELEIADLFAESLNTGEPVTFSKIVQRLVEKGITEERLTDEDLNQVITTEGYVINVVSDENGTWRVGVIADSIEGIYTTNKIYPDVEVVTPVETITLVAVDTRNGIRKITLPDGTEKTYNGDNTVKEEVSVYANGRYTFVVENTKGETKTHEVEIVNVVVGSVAIVANKDLDTWQNEPIEVEVLWPDNIDNLSKEISVDNGATYVPYTGKVQISANTTIKARLMYNGQIAKEAEDVVITKLDTEKPATPTITNPSNGVETENDVTITVASSDSISGIAKYQVYYGGSWHDRNETGDTLTDTFTEEMNETIKYRVMDLAGNMSDEATTTLNIAKIKATITNMTSGDLAVSATVALTGNLDYANTKYVFTTSNTALGTNASSYTDGTISSANSTITKAKTQGTYYLHILATSNSGYKKELISDTTATSQGKKNFDYTGAEQNITLTPGTYKLEVWGAQGGGDSAGNYGGKGAYVTGTYTVTSNTILYAYVGGQGQKAYTRNDYSTGVYSYGGYNGGGNGNGGRGPGGGGATDFRTTNGTWNNTNSLNSRIIVAGAGGGDAVNNIATSKGRGNTSGSTYTLGQGANGSSGWYGSNSQYAGDTGGGGGGYYGGSSISGDDPSLGYGGTSFANSSLTNVSYVEGDSSMTKPDGTTETGHSGNGYARITVIN